MLARSSQGRSSAGRAGGLRLLPLLLGLMMMMMRMEAASVEEVASEESQEILEEDEILVRTEVRWVH